MLKLFPPVSLPLAAPAPASLQRKCPHVWLCLPAPTGTLHLAVLWHSAGVYAKNKSVGMVAQQAHLMPAYAWDASQHSKEKFARETSSVKCEKIIFIKAVQEFEEQDPFLLHALHAWAWRESQSEESLSSKDCTWHDPTKGRQIDGPRHTERSTAAATGAVRLALKGTNICDRKGGQGLPTTTICSTQVWYHWKDEN